MPTAPRIEVNVLGRVIGATGEPLPWTWLEFSSDDPRLHEYNHTFTDSSGAYSVRLLSGSYRVVVEPPEGYLSRVEQAEVSSRHSRLDITLSGYHVRGTLLDPNGSVLDSGWVLADLPGVGSASSNFRGGGFSLRLPAGRYSFRAVNGNYLGGLPPLESQSVPISADTLIAFHLGGIPVSGTVLGPDGVPKQDVRVEVETTGLYVQSVTGADGRYRLYVQSGSYRVLFRPPYPFFIIPRVVGPVTIATPASIDCDLSGIEWTGIVRRSGTNDPVSRATVAVDMLDDADYRGAAIYTGPQGEFRFIMEAGRRYDLLAYDPNTHRIAATVRGITATSDTTFEILLPPTP